MQSTSKEIYKLTAERTGKSQEVYKDIGNFILLETYQTLRKPKSLITKLKGVGFWFLRKKQLEQRVAQYPKGYEEKIESDFDSITNYQAYLERREVFIIFKRMLVDYDKYISKKREIKGNKHASETIHRSKEDS
jgi:hypothetical protein